MSRAVVHSLVITAYHHFAVIGDRWKLLHASGFGSEGFEGKPKFELYDLKADPRERNNVAQQQPEVFKKLKQTYDDWFQRVGSTRPDNYAPPRIHIGTPHENPVTLTRQDWRHLAGRPWQRDSVGQWKLKVATAGTYRLDVRFGAAAAGEKAVAVIRGMRLEKSLKAGDTSFFWEGVSLKPGDLSLKIEIVSDDKSRGPHQVDVTKD